MKVQTTHRSVPVGSLDPFVRPLQTQASRSKDLPMPLQDLNEARLLGTAFIGFGSTNRCKATERARSTAGSQDHHAKKNNQRRDLFARSDGKNAKPPPTTRSEHRTAPAAPCWNERSHEATKPVPATGAVLSGSMKNRPDKQTSWQAYETERQWERSRGERWARFWGKRPPFLMHQDD